MWLLQRLGRVGGQSLRQGPRLCRPPSLALPRWCISAVSGKAGLSASRFSSGCEPRNERLASRVRRGPPRSAPCSQSNLTNQLCLRFPGWEASLGLPRETPPGLEGCRLRILQPSDHAEGCRGERLGSAPGGTARARLPAPGEQRATRSASPEAGGRRGATAFSQHVRSPPP